MTAIENDDTDGDGFTNLVEINAGTSPGDASSTPPTANTPPVADDKVVATNQDTPVDITLTGSDDDLDPLTYAVVAGPANGTLSGAAPNLTYTPDTGFSGSDSFTYNANDGTDASNTATVSITVTAVASNTPPVADDKVVATNEDTPVAVTLTGSDDDLDPLTYAVVAGPANGTLSGAEPNLTYTPDTGFSGSDSFTYNANDGMDASNTATVTITVTGDTPPPTGDLPKTSPADGEEGVSVTKTVEITFNEVDGNSNFSDSSGIEGIVNKDTFSLMVEGSPGPEPQWYRDDDDDDHIQCVTNGIVNGTFAYEGLTATFTPVCKLAKNTTYRATLILPQEAKPFIWSFTTIARTPDSDDDGVEDGEDDEDDDDKDATPPKSKGKGKFRYRLRNHESAYLRNVGGISDTHYSINQTGKPVGYEFPDGLVDAEIHDVAPGETVDVELTLTEAVPEGSKVYMADAAGFREVPAVISGDTVTLTLSGADVGNGDVPPIGVAVPNATGDGSIGVATDAAGGGCSVVGGGGGWKEAAGSYGLLTLVWLGLALRRRKPETGR
ncbi:MAG: Ig-like domain-containing protein [Candidatus Deferrimicrobiaceae bacterium]